MNIWVQGMFILIFNGEYLKLCLFYENTYVIEIIINIMKGSRTNQKYGDCGMNTVKLSSLKKCCKRPCHLKML